MLDLLFLGHSLASDSVPTVILVLGASLGRIPVVFECPRLANP